MNKPADGIRLTTSLGPSARFFSESAFKSWNFLFITLMCFVNLCFAVFLLFRSWQVSNFVALVAAGFSMLCIFGTWTLVYSSHSSIRILFENARIRGFEDDSPLEDILTVLSELVFAGVRYACLSFLSGLFAAILLYGRRH
jgi:hypothetical protein